MPRPTHPAHASGDADAFARRVPRAGRRDLALLEGWRLSMPPQAPGALAALPARADWTVRLDAARRPVHGVDGDDPGDGGRDPHQ